MQNMSRDDVLRFRVLHFRAVQLGASFSRPAFSADRAPGSVRDAVTAGTTRHLTAAATHLPTSPFSVVS